MYSPSRKKGNIAEDIVISHLKNIGFHILDRNYLKKWGEIDIVAEKSQKIHFIEVKSSIIRNTNNFIKTHDDGSWKIYVLNDSEAVSRETSITVNPVWNMTKNKKMRFSRIITTYLADKYRDNMPDFQVDLISALLDFYGKLAYISRIENILLDS